MTQDNAPDYLPLVQALADRKTIQQYVNGEWQNNPCPTFSLEPKYYRIKPDPRRWWLNIYEGDNGTIQLPFLTRDDADKFSVGSPRPRVDCVEVVEVLK